MQVRDLLPVAPVAWLILTVFGGSALAGPTHGFTRDTFSLYTPILGKFAISNSNTSPIQDASPRYGPYGNAGWLPVAGNYDATGTDTVGLYNPVKGKFSISNDESRPIDEDASLRYGPVGGPGWLPLVCNWDGTGADTAGLYNPQKGKFLITNDEGAPLANDAVMRFGPVGNAGWLPICGNWDGN